MDVLYSTVLTSDSLNRDCQYRLTVSLAVFDSESATSSVTSPTPERDLNDVTLTYSGQRGSTDDPGRVAESEWRSLMPYAVIVILSALVLLGFLFTLLRLVLAAAAHYKTYAVG